jgi:hypothetical protein
MTWRTTSIVLFVVVIGLLFRDCTRAAPAIDKPASAKCESSTRTVTEFADSDHGATDEVDKPATSDGGFSINGFKVPAWAMWLAPHPGEDLRAYRDRMLPLAQAAVAPHRARVARSRDDFAALAHLDTRQLAALDAAAKQASDALEEKALAAIMNGDFAPATFKPMTAVSTARDMLDVVDKANQRFVGALSDEQRAQLAQHPFDFADYLVFSTKWEDMLNAFN